LARLYGAREALLLPQDFSSVSTVVEITQTTKDEERRREQVAPR
jgi:hypothetical protein